MKGLVFFAMMLVVASHAVGECDPNINEHDTIGDVKKKLACLAAENAKLKENLATLQSQEASKNSMINTAIAEELVSRDKFPVDTCKSDAVRVAVRRGGKILINASRTVEFTLEDMTVVVSCNIMGNTSITVSSGAKQKGIDLSKVLRTEILSGHR